MLERPDQVTPALLRDWPLPDAGYSKYDRGRILVVGGAARTPGAVQLAGLAALRVGAGHLTMAVAASAATALAVAVPEAGVVGLPENDRGSVLGDDLGAIADDLRSADVVIVGPGLDDAEQTTTLARRLLPSLNDHAWLVLDAYALSAVWATYAHAASGDRLAARVGRLGCLAREILDELPGILVELET